VKPFTRGSLVVRRSDGEVFRVLAGPFFLEQRYWSVRHIVAFVMLGKRQLVAESDLDEYRPT
jgi:hypothetical protein